MSSTLLLLTGIPGSGKTEAGHTLAQRHGFAHLDAERHAAKGVASIEAWVALLEEFLKQAQSLIRAKKSIVITWGFMPGVDNITIRALQGMGFQMIWFDGDRDAARREFLKRGTVSEEAFNVQMRKIAKLDLASFSPTPFNPFDEQGQFLPREDIAKQLMELSA